MASRHRSIALLYVCLSIARCGGGGGSTTPTPTPSTPTVTSVAVTGAGAPVVGDTVQLAATATMSDGTTQAVTGQATWESSNQAVATVTAAGVATFLAQGDADLKATYKSVSGTAHVTVTTRTSPKYTLTGTVSDATNGNPLPGVNARLLLADATDTGKSGVSGADGKYSIANVSAGTFLVQFTRSDYETRSVGVTVNGDTSLDVKITANQASVTRFYGTYNVALTIQQQGCSFPFNVGPTGTVKLEGNTSGSSLTVTIVERGTTRRYAGSIKTDGSFSGTNLDTVIAGFTPPQNKHSYNGTLSGSTTGSSINATEAITFGDPCPGATMKIGYSGSK